VVVAISIPVPSYLPAAVPAVVAVMIIDYRALISRKAPVIGVVVFSAAVIAIMVVPYNSRVGAEAVVVAVTISITEAVIIAVAEARILAEARFVGAPPLPVLPLALTVQAVVLHIVVMALREPLAVGVIVVSAPIVAAAVIRAGVVPVLGAAGKDQRSKNQS
jgi:hypothetical protein